MPHLVRHDVHGDSGLPRPPRIRLCATAGKAPRVPWDAAAETGRFRSGSVRRNCSRATSKRTCSSTGTSGHCETSQSAHATTSRHRPNAADNQPARSAVSPMRMPVRRVSNKTFASRSSLRRRNSACRRASSSGVNGRGRCLIGTWYILAQQQAGAGGTNGRQAVRIICATGSNARHA